jgi:branched-chain amino acid transport system ATP-binding protein
MRAEAEAPMPHQTQDFDRLYRIVTGYLESFVAEGQRDPIQPISAQDAAWLRYLIGVFRQLFDDWQIDRDLDVYLSSLETWPPGAAPSRRVHRMFRLAGHVYLHVAFDLTRGLAGTVPVPTGPAVLLVPGPSTSFVTPAPVVASTRPGARELFQRAAPAFDRSLQSDRVLALLGEVTFWAKLLGYFTRKRRQQLLAIMAPWVRSLRSEAWTMAERILDTPPVHRAGLVTRLRTGVIDAQMRVAERFRIGDLHPFLFPTLGVAAPVGVAGWLDTATALGSAAAALIIAGWAMLYRSAQRHQEEVMAAVDALGEALADAMAELTGKSEIDNRVRPRPTAGPVPLSVHELSLRHGGVNALDFVSFDVREREVFGIVGPNGAGKTSLLDSISGLRTGWQGEIASWGRSLRGMQPRQVVRAGIVRGLPVTALSRRTTVFDQIMLGRTPLDRGALLPRLLGLRSSRHERMQSRRSVWRLIDFFGLHAQRDAVPAELPLELQRRVALATALAAQPTVLLVDEPMAGLSSDEQGDMAQLIQRIGERYQVTIVLAEHNARAAMDLCDRLVVLDHGKKVAEGTPAELSAAVAAAYRSEASAGG